MAIKRTIVGNSAISGFVNHVAEGRFTIGTGSMPAPAGRALDDGIEPKAYSVNGKLVVYKSSVSVFMDPKFDGQVPEKGDYVEVRTDLVFGPRKDKPEEANVTMNVRFANQVVKKDAPTKKADAPADAHAGEDI